MNLHDSLPSEISIGPSLRICQLNVEGISLAKCEYLHKMLTKHNVDVLLLQETHTKDMQDLESRGKILGYNIISAHNHAKYGIVTYARESLTDISILPTKVNPSNFYLIAIKVQDTSIVNIYKPPAQEWGDGLPVFPHPCIFAGDFNSHHIAWRYDSNDLNGIHLQQWAEQNSFHLVFDAKEKGSFRSARWKRDYNPDLTFVSCESSGVPFPITRNILCNFPNSQHRPVLMKTGNQIPLMKSMPLPRWNLQKADWVAFANDMDSAIRWIPPIAENYSRFVGLTTATAKKYIPRGYRKTYVPGWSEESEQLYRQYKSTGDQEIGRNLLESLDTERKNKWLTTVEKMDFKTSSRKAWNVLNKLTGKSGSRNVCVSQKLTDSIANRVVETSRVKGDRPHTKTVKKLSQNCKKELSADEFISRPFTEEETTYAIKQLKLGKAAGEDGIYNEFIKNLGPNCRKWLTNFYADILARNKLPPLSISPK
ncbi:uncharacterized protein LOC125236889 [Leguminivora glycinivorella]|uniref:uncharacterized protein LOC125236889 n=1 Tax=Leguminivora glycinivorella TaxID=1035111 RepID=UPI00200FC7FE|nr:uncharacterized protein LOC125236889 [Leguminivora glycinivorella]